MRTKSEIITDWCRDQGIKMRRLYLFGYPKADSVSECWHYFHNEYEYETDPMLKEHFRWVLRQLDAPEDVWSERIG